MRQVLAGLILAAVLFLAGLFVGHFVWTGEPNYVLDRKTQVVYRVRPTREAREAPRVPVAPARCKTLTEIADEALLAEVARRHALPDLAPGVEAPRSLLTLGTLADCPRFGAELAVTLGEGETEPTVTSVPLPAPAFAFRRDWSARIGPAIVAGQDGAGWGALIELDWRFAQTRQLDHGVTLVGVASPDNPAVAAAYTVGFGSH